MNMKMKLGEFIKHVREEKKLSQGEIARKAGLARSYISRLEEGDFNSPSVITLIRLAEGLGVSNEMIFRMAGVEVKESDLPAFDVYCRVQLGLPEEGVRKMEEFLELLKLKYADTDKQEVDSNAT